MPRLPIGRANSIPPLRCERLEDRSLLSTSGLTPWVVDGAILEMVSCVETPANSIVVQEDGQVVFLYDGPIETAEWIEEQPPFEDESWDDSWYYEDELYYDDTWYSEHEVYADDSWYYEDEIYEDWYYEDEAYFEEDWYYEDEVYYEEDWYYEEDYWDDSWYYEDELGFEDVVLDSGGMTWEEYEEVWLDWDRSIDLVLLTPADAAGDWIGTADAWTTLNDGMVYAMAVSGGIAIPEAPLAAEDTPIVDLLPLPVTTPETDSAAELALALPPAAADLATPPDITAPQDAESTETATVLAPEPAETEETAPTLFAALVNSDDHLTEGESLELSEDLPVG
jgi:hypothetical protein